MKKIVVFTGSGISAESGIRTFRDSGGLWEEYEVSEVATPEGWKKNPGLVLDFYNKRRKQILEAQPNAAHFAIAELQKKFDVHIITQNIDDLHERAGSANVLHLHGEIKKAQSTADTSLVYDIKGPELNKGDLCEKKSQLRPHIVWFGELVPAIEPAIRLTSEADIFIVIGTSLNVYPAAGLVGAAKEGISKFLVDPNAGELNTSYDFHRISEKASIGVPLLAKKLLTNSDPSSIYA